MKIASIASTLLILFSFAPFPLPMRRLVGQETTDRAELELIKKAFFSTGPTDSPAPTEPASPTLIHTNNSQDSLIDEGADCLENGVAFSPPVVESSHNVNDFRPRDAFIPPPSMPPFGCHCAPAQAFAPPAHNSWISVPHWIPPPFPLPSSKRLRTAASPSTTTPFLGFKALPFLLSSRTATRMLRIAIAAST